MDRKDALLVAIRNEIKAKEVYEKIALMVANFVLKEKCQFLANEEEKHRSKLEALFKRLFLNDEISEPAIAKNRPDLTLDDDAAVPELLASAMEAELESEKFYNELAASSEDEPTKEFFEYLAKVEKSHYYLVKAEYEIAKDDEAYYTTSDAGYWPGMSHVGP